MGSAVGRHQSRDPRDVARRAEGLLQCCAGSTSRGQAVRRCLHAGSFDEQLDADLQFHLEQATAEYIREGLSPDEARTRGAESLRQSGARHGRRARDVHVDLVGTAGSGSSLRPSRLPAELRRSPPRPCCRSPSASAPTTAIFSIFNTLMLRPLPVRDPSTLFQVLHSGDGGVVRKLHLRALRASEDPREDDRRRLPGRPDIDDAGAGRRPGRGGRRTASHGRLLQRAGHPAGHRDRDRAARRGRARRRTASSSSATPTGRVGLDATLASSAGRSRSTRCRTPLSASRLPSSSGLQVGRRVDVSVPLDGSEEQNFWKSRALVVRLAPGVSRDGRDGRPERGVSAVPRRRQDAVGPRSRPGVQIAGPRAVVIRPFRIPRSVRQTGAGDAGDRRRAAGDRVRESRESLSGARGRAAARSLGVPGARRKPNSGWRASCSRKRSSSRWRAERSVCSLASWGVDVLVGVPAGIRRVNRPADSS